MHFDIPLMIGTPPAGRRLGSRALPGIAISVLLAGTTACAPETGAPANANEDPGSTTAVGADPPATVVDTTVEEFAFNAPATLPSGWNHLRMTNDGKQPHFLALARLPEGRTFDEYAAQVAKPFNDGYRTYRSGTVSRGAFLDELGGLLPEWFGQVQFAGGVGLVSPGRTAESWVRLDPGDYVVECYVVAPEEGIFHNDLGMLRPLIVSEEESGAQPPEADVVFALSNYQIEMQGELGRGVNTVAVRVDEAADGLVAHDLHLARLDEDTDLDAIVAWTDWVDALTPPAPAEFLGGAEGTSVPGRTSYVRVDLEPGRYAWISEGYGAEGMTLEFTIE